MIDIKVISQAYKSKPAYESPCNNCGWCCLTEVCAVGVELSGSKDLPCKFMRTEGDTHFCKIAEVEQLQSVLGIGLGCDAKTQAEIIKSYKKT
jgi:uncharacterized cysteine cluster protein YcgN (CxxCxxCC family)